MTEYVNSGTLFSNKVKKNAKSPDYFGDATLDLSALGIGSGKHKIKLSGWKKTSSKGTSFLSLSISKFEDRQAEPQAEPEKDEDVPF